MTGDQEVNRVPIPLSSLPGGLGNRGQIFFPRGLPWAGNEGSGFGGRPAGKYRQSRSQTRENIGLFRFSRCAGDRQLAKTDLAWSLRAAVRCRQVVAEGLGNTHLLALWHAVCILSLASSLHSGASPWPPSPWPPGLLVAPRLHRQKAYQESSLADQISPRVAWFGTAYAWDWRPPRMGQEPLFPVNRLLTIGPEVNGVLGPKML